MLTAHEATLNGAIALGETGVFLKYFHGTQRHVDIVWERRDAAQDRRNKERVESWAIRLSLR